MQSKMLCNIFTQPMRCLLHELNMECGPVNGWVCLQPLLWEQMGWRAHRRWYLWIVFVHMMRIFRNAAKWLIACCLCNALNEMRKFITTSTATIFGSIIEELSFNVVTVDVNFLFYSMLCFSLEFIAWVFYCWCSRMRLIIEWAREFSGFSRWIHRVEFSAHYRLIRLPFRGW